MKSVRSRKDKVVLDLGNMFISKNKEFFLSKGLKTIDKIRIRNESGLDEDQVKNTFTEFLEKNELYQYDKIYLTGSHSDDNIGLISNIINQD